MGRMSLSIYMKGYYEDFYGFGRRKNKANSKPNKANLFRIECCVMRIASWFCHSCGNRNPELLMVLDSASSTE